MSYCHHLCLLSWLFVVTLPSCVQDVIMDAHEKPQVVVACILSDKAEQTLLLSFTKGASLEEAPPLTEAKVTLFEREWERDDFHEVGHFKRIQGSEWTLAYKAIPGKHYRLEVEVPGYDLITSEQTMPQVAKIRSRGFTPYQRVLMSLGLRFPSGMDVFPSGMAERGFVRYGFVPNAEDFESLPLGVKCYYVLDLPDPVWIYAMNYDPETGEHHIAEEICTECPLVDDFNTSGENYVAPERTDVPNPYVEGSHVAKLAPQLEGKPLHRHYLRFPPRNLSVDSGWWFMVAGSMQGKYNCRDFYQIYYGDEGGLAEPLSPDEGYIEATTVSKDLDEYLQDAYYMQQLQESSDLTTIFLRDNSFTNIHGGLGIFGAKCSRKYQWSGEYEYVDDGMVHIHYSGPANNPANNGIYYDPTQGWDFLYDD